VLERNNSFLTALLLPMSLYSVSKGILSHLSTINNHCGALIHTLLTVKQTTVAFFVNI
jgi:hypothetical protein